MKTKVSVIGLGARGLHLLKLLLNMEDTEVVAICDKSQKYLLEASSLCFEKYGKQVMATTDSNFAINRDDIDAVFIFTSWNSHISLAYQAMRAGKYVGVEVGPGASLDEAWRLVRISEETKMPCMMLENCCYGETEMLVGNMIKQGLFGEIVHCEAGYCHDCRVFADDLITGAERGFHYLVRDCDLYPTHGLGPIMNWLKINRGNRFECLTSMTSKSVGMTEWFKQKHPDSDVKFKAGDVATTMIKCSNGETVFLTYNCSNPRPYSRKNLVQGTKGIYSEDCKGIFIEGKSEHHEWQSLDEYKEYTHPLWKNSEEFKDAGHGGMDWLVLRAFIDAVKNKTEVPFDVYDAAVLLAICVIAEESVSKGSAVLPIPDFTDGRWVTRRPKHISDYSLDY